MASSKILLSVLLSFIFGVFISSFLNVPEFIIYELFVLGAFYVLIFLRDKLIIVFGVCLIILGLGILKTEIVKNYYQALTLTETEARPLSVVYRIESSKTSVISEKILPFKQKLRNIIYQNLSPPQSSILGAIILGDKKYISPEWKEKLNRAGVRHITAISGMHIVILSGILMWLGIILGLFRGQAFWFSITFLWLFIVMVGMPSSAVRAGIMGSVFLFCQKIGRQNAAARSLVLAGGAMLVHNPLLLRYDIGFQLSFLAVLGIIYLMPFFQKILEKIKILGAFGISGILAMTFSAQVFTLPILIYNFGQFSLVAPLANILIVPILPYIMTSAFLFLLLSLIWQPLGWIFSFLVWLLLSYLTSLVNFFSHISFSSLSFSISWLWLIGVYAILAGVVWYILRKEKIKFLKY